jgi:hypothetical protein
MSPPSQAANVQSWQGKLPQTAGQAAKSAWRLQAKEALPAGSQEECVCLL